MDEDCDAGDNGTGCCVTKGIRASSREVEGDRGENDTTTRTRSSQYCCAEVNLSYLCVLDSDMRPDWLRSKDHPFCVKDRHPSHHTRFIAIAESHLSHFTMHSSIDDHAHLLVSPDLPDDRDIIPSRHPLT